MLIDTNSFEIYDISMPITRFMPVYKGKEQKKPVFDLDSDFSSGTSFETRLEMNLHTGTHLDAPLHMIPGGNTVGKIDLSKVVTVCKVLDLTDVKDKITENDLKKFSISKGDFLLFKTRNSFEDILENEFVYLDKIGAKYLSDLNIRGVGIDALGIERNQPGHETHISLLSSDIIILEGLRLKDIKEGEYLLCAAPILIPQAEAAPVRAYLIKSAI